MTIIPHIDEAVCLAHGDCEAIAPGVFSLEDVAVVVGNGPEALLRQAAAACPAAAIVLLDAETGEEVG